MKKLTYFLFLFLFVASACHKTTVPETPIVPLGQIEFFKDSVMGVIYNPATTTIAYNKPDANGIYKIYTANFDGTNEVQLTYSGWGSDKHQWAEEWDPTGQFLICYIEKSVVEPEPNHTRVSDDAIPGYGGYTDIWIVKKDGSQAWQMTDFINDYDHGVIHGGIAADGTLFAWTERIQRPQFSLNLGAGAYVFKLEDVTWGPTPTFTNIRTYQPGGVLAGGEVESISPDKQSMLVYSSFETNNMIETPIYKIDIASGNVTKLFEGSFSQAPTYTPNGQQIVFMSGKNCDVFFGQLQGADWWIMNADGTQPKRLTYMNKKNSPQCVNAYRLAGSLSFVNDSTFIGGIMTSSFGLKGYSALVKF